MREKLIELLFDCVSENLTLEQKSSNRFTIEIHHGNIADHLIANDVVPVVRCKDCKHFIQEEHGCNHFGYYSHTPWVDEVAFCSYGERREGE